MKEPSIILAMGTYPPRECGIATFTKDLMDAIDIKFSSVVQSKIIAMNKGGNIYNYSDKVMFQINDEEICEYINTAKKINKDDSIKAVSIQHEFGLFGGEWGEYLLAFLEVLEKPVIVTFHSVLPKPEKKLKLIVKEIADRVDTLVVMTDAAIKILREDYGIKKTHIEIIPHGVHGVSFESQDKEKEKFDLSGKLVLSSFGMISSGKGYEYVIDSLPKVVEKFPNLVYLIVGATHPVVRREEGEKYRNKLENKVKKLGLQKHVRFYNKYVELDEILSFLKASDIYVSASLTPEQITSGTLVYAMSCGRTTVSTPFLHAKDAVTEERGRLVKFRNAKSFTNALLELLADEKLRKSMENNAYIYTRQMVWDNVAFSYMNVIKEYFNMEDVYVNELPRINMHHLQKLTDDFGMIQFSKYTTPDIASGYTLDDNARALFVCAEHFNMFNEFKQLNLIKVYLDYMKFVQDKDGKIYNFVDENKRIDFNNWSEDAHGRALYALGHLVASEKIPVDLREQAKRLFNKSLNVSKNFLSPRAVAFSAAGLHFFNEFKPSKDNLELLTKFANYLVELYKDNSNSEWKWFEDRMTYSNSRLPEALFYAYMSTNNKKYLDIATESMDFLIAKTFVNGIFVPIGQNGWYVKGEERAFFDQQPVDVGCMVQSLILARQVTGDKKYNRYALDAFNWFLGRNSLQQMLYDSKSGCCFDGLGKKSINVNSGAESTLAYLTARLGLLNS